MRARLSRSRACQRVRWSPSAWHTMMRTLACVPQFVGTFGDEDSIEISYGERPVSKAPGHAIVPLIQDPCVRPISSTHSNAATSRQE